MNFTTDEWIIKIPNRLNVSMQSYNILANLQHTILETDERKIILDFSNTVYVSALYMAFFGSLEVLCRKKNQKLVYRLRKDTELYHYFQSSGLYEFMRPRESFVDKNAIPFSLINMEEDSIMSYINRILDLAPVTLNPEARAFLFTNIYEIFSNSSEHSESDCGVFACGHWMQRKKKLAFSVYDMGIGIPGAIRKYKDASMSSEDALRWALKTGNSTKQLNDGVPRGIGLPNILDFINLNKGALYVLSNDIFYSYENGKEHFETFKYSIRGTMISLIIISDDEYIYELKEELQC